MHADILSTDILSTDILSTDLIRDVCADRYFFAFEYNLGGKF